MNGYFSMEYTSHPNILFAILCTKLALMIIYCTYKFTVEKLITLLIVRSFIRNVSLLFIKYGGVSKSFRSESIKKYTLTTINTR
jgi:hypothetical protein